jgi:hypothetical protein
LSNKVGELTVCIECYTPLIALFSLEEIHDFKCVFFGQLACIKVKLYFVK